MSVFIPNFKPKAQSKYKNTKIELDGHVFDSKAECERYKNSLVVLKKTVA